MTVRRFQQNRASISTSSPPSLFPPTNLASYADSVLGGLRSSMLIEAGHVEANCCNQALSLIDLPAPSTSDIDLSPIDPESGRYDLRM
jgi:hypothetical protein